MKSLKKTLALLLLCGVACGLNAAAAVKVDQSSKAAAFASAMRAALLNDPDAFWVCCSSRAKEQIGAKSKAANMSEKEFLVNEFQKLQEKFVRKVPFCKVDGKWYIEFDQNEAMEAESKADYTAQAAVFAQLISTVLLEDVDGFWSCLSIHSRNLFQTMGQQQGMTAADVKKALLTEMRNNILNDDADFIQKNGKWYLNNFDDSNN